PRDCQSGRQESNLPRTAHQTVASPLGYGPLGQRPVRDSNPSRLFDKQVATPAASQGVRVSGGSRTRLSDAAGRCLGCSATDTQQGRKESNPLRAGWSRTALPGARPCQKAAQAGLEPAAVSLTASRSTI